jgi:hypothetical protein
VDSDLGRPRLFPKLKIIEIHVFKSLIFSLKDGGFGNRKINALHSLNQNNVNFVYQPNIKTWDPDSSRRPGI